MLSGSDSKSGLARSKVVNIGLQPGSAAILFGRVSSCHVCCCYSQKCSAEVWGDLDFTQGLQTMHHPYLPYHRIWSLLSTQMELSVSLNHFFLFDPGYS